MDSVIGHLLFLLHITTIASHRHTILVSDNLESSNLFYDPHLTLIVISDQAMNGCEQFWAREKVEQIYGAPSNQSIKAAKKEGCKIWNLKITQANKYSEHGYHHTIETKQFDNFNIKVWDYWLQIYERLVMYDGVLEYYEIENPRNKYQRPHYLKSWGLISHANFIFSQLNKDNFSLMNFCKPKPILRFFGNSLPRGLQNHFEQQSKQSVCHHKIAIEFDYYCSSCLTDDACNVKYKRDYYKDFTLVFRSNDRLFCDVFWYHNVTGNWVRNTKNVADYNKYSINEAPQWTVSPHASNSICYEVSGTSFIILQEPPSFSDNLIRPFELRVWIAIVVSLVSTWLVLLISLLVLNIDAINRQIFLDYLELNISIDMKAYGVRFLKKLAWFSIKFLYFVYSAILLFTLLRPAFHWTPTTYAGLNETSSISLSSTANSIIDVGQVREVLKLTNQIGNSNKYYFYISDLFEEDDRSTEYRLAIMMYSMDVDYYVSSRRHVYNSAEYALRIIRSKESARNQLGFISASPISPHLHFLINGMQRIVEGGLYDKWLQMEKHFYSYVSPVLASNYLEFNNIEIPLYYLGVARTLGIEEFSPTLILLTALLSFTLGFATIEVLTNQNSRDVLRVWIRLKWYKVSWIWLKFGLRIRIMHVEIS